MLCGHANYLIPLDKIEGKQDHAAPQFGREILLTFRVRLARGCKTSCKLFIWRKDDDSDQDEDDDPENHDLVCIIFCFHNLLLHIQTSK